MTYSLNQLNNSKNDEMIIIFQSVSGEFNWKFHQVFGIVAILQTNFLRVNNVKQIILKLIFLLTARRLHIWNWMRSWLATHIQCDRTMDDVACCGGRRWITWLVDGAWWNCMRWTAGRQVRSQTMFFNCLYVAASSRWRWVDGFTWSKSYFVLSLCSAQCRL